MQQNRQWLEVVIMAAAVIVAWTGVVVAQGFAAEAPVERTGQTTSFLAGDDGDFQAGVPLPSPRFTDNLDGTVTDNLTGLIWLRNANCFGFRTWYQGVMDINALASGSCWLSDGSVAGDWRMPNVKELQSLIHFGFVNPALSNSAGTGKWTGGLVCSGIGDAFPGLEAAGYWTSTTTAASPSIAVRVRMNSGATVLIIKDTTELVWAVRGGATPPFPAEAPVEQTGQTRSFFAGDDGDFQAGVPLPSPRFTDNLDGTVTDNLTGLIWLRNANCYGLRTWSQAVADANTLASGSCGLTDGSVAGNWRLPNIKELQSLVHWGFGNPTLSNAAGTGRWTEGDAFSLVQSRAYWSSTSHPTLLIGAWHVRMDNSSVNGVRKDALAFVWPVWGPGAE